MRRGADVHRTDKLRTLGTGMTWQARFAWRGRERQLQIRLLKLDPTQQLSLGFDGPSVEGMLNIELVELSAKRTRMMMQVELKPRTLPARLFIQSMKLARGRTMKKYEARLQAIARDIELRFAGQPTL